MNRPSPLTLVPALLLAISLSGCARERVEQPDYKVVKKDGPVEIRDYPALKVATVPMGKDGNDDGSFMKLFRYIDGGNAANQKIAMTSPVLVGRGQSQTMGFIVPKAVAAGEVPAPAKPEITIGALAAGQFAVLDFPGARDQEIERKALARLHEWLAKAGLEATGDPVFAYYDPPWTPVPFRRNEVMLRLKSPVPAGAPAPGR